MKLQNCFAFIQTLRCSQYNLHKINKINQSKQNIHKKLSMHIGKFLYRNAYNDT